MGQNDHNALKDIYLRFMTQMTSKYYETLRKILFYDDWWGGKVWKPLELGK